MLKSIMCQHQSVQQWAGLSWEVLKGSLPGLKTFKWEQWSVERRLLEWDMDVPEGPLMEKRSTRRSSMHTLAKELERQENHWKNVNKSPPSFNS